MNAVQAEYVETPLKEANFCTSKWDLDLGGRTAEMARLNLNRHHMHA